MADTLEGYLATDYLAEKQDIADVERTLDAVAATFRTTFAVKGWPYQFRTGTSQAKTSSDSGLVSQGTLAMVLMAISHMRGYCKRSSSEVTNQKKKTGDEATLFKAWTVGLETLAKNVEAEGIKSGTFGDDNPLTLSHVSELLEHLSKDGYPDEQTKIRLGTNKSKSSLKKLLNKNPALTPLLEPADKQRSYCVNSFVPLRALRAASTLSVPIDGLDHFETFFESNLHDHLSFSSIPDSRFDPAELVFCLEGLLLCAPEAVDASLFHRVLEVLTEKQNTSAHWRPTKPFLASEKGDIILPVSVEVANSLMRSTELFDGERQYETFTAKALPLIQRFWHWLRARAVRFPDGLSLILEWALKPCGK